MAEKKDDKISKRDRRTQRRDARRLGRKDSGNRLRVSRHSGRPPLEFHRAICSRCKKECEVPFKPSSSKPVLCSDCFKKKQAPQSSQPGPDIQARLKFIESKLDKLSEDIAYIRRKMDQG